MHWTVFFGDWLSGDWLAVATPTPSPLPNTPIDETLISPGWIGFIVIFSIAVATVLLILDMTRRVRRVRYRSEVRDMLAAEEAEREGRRDDQS